MKYFSKTGFTWRARSANEAIRSNGESRKAQSMWINKIDDESIAVMLPWAASLTSISTSQSIFTPEKIKISGLKIAVSIRIPNDARLNLRNNIKYDIKFCLEIRKLGNKMYYLLTQIKINLLFCEYMNRRRFFPSEFVGLFSIFCWVLYGDFVASWFPLFSPFRSFSSVVCFRCVCAHNTRKCIVS